MRKLSGAFALAVASIAASPAAAQDGVIRVPGPTEVKDPGTHTTVTTERVQSRWYVGGEFGAMIVEDTDVDIGAVDNALRLNYDYGYDGGLFVGYDLGAFRIEAEAAYKKADLEGFNTLIRLPGEGTVFPSGRGFAGGSTSALSFMINGMLDFGDDKNVGGVSGFVGGGIGMARVKANNERVFANTAPFLDDSDSKLAWQVFAGVRQKIKRDLDVTVKYRFFNVDDVRMVAFNGNESEHRFRSHSLLGGITYRFGRTKRIEVSTLVCEADWKMNPSTNKCERETTILVRVCPPDTTHHPLDYVCPVVGPFIVFFDWDRPAPDEPEPDKLSAAARRVLDAAAAEYDRNGSAQVLIDGHADTSGDPKYNLGLSRDRAMAVRNYLVGKGVPEGAVATFGETCPIVDDGDGIREPQNRRVEVYYGGRPDTFKCVPTSDY